MIQRVQREDVGYSPTEVYGAFKTCWDGSIISEEGVCPPETHICPDGKEYPSYVPCMAQDPRTGQWKFPSIVPPVTETGVVSDVSGQGQQPSGLQPIHIIAIAGVVTALSVTLFIVTRKKEGE